MEPQIDNIASVDDRPEERHTIHSLPVLIIHAHSSCNCRCIMCDIWTTKESRAFSVRDLEKQLPAIRRLGVQWVIFSGGEPLLNPVLPQLCALLRKERIRLTLLTTGLLLQKFAVQVTSSFDDVIVSLDGPREIHDHIRRVHGAFNLLETGVSALRNVRADFPIHARTTVQKANCHSLRETARAAKQLSLNSISFLAADLSSTAFNRSLVWPLSRQSEIGLSPDELPVLENEIAGLIDDAEGEYEPGFISESPAKLRRIARHFAVQLGLAPAQAPVCNAPWVSAVIDVDGAVRPCFFHQAIGHLASGDLSEVVNGEPARSFRSKLDIATDPTCGNCVCSLNYRL